MNTAVNTNQFNYRFKLTDYSLFDRNRARRVAIYGRVSTEHEAQLSALDNQLQWYDDQVRYHPNWDVVAKYIDEGITGTQAKKRPDFLRMIEDAKQGKFDLIVTREVCRFARNVVDTLVVTRELKSIGVEVFFIEDNIWTMDGDGELRLSLMATLAQEESRKTSERVKAGQKISRDNGVLYGNGNILGYDRVGDTYVINEEQAETVRMIYDLYLQGYGSMKIAGILTERKRKTASGLVKWSVSNIMRAIRNATYTGTKCYNKSRSNNFLEQKRINNLDMSTYEYVEGDFPAIISQEIWDKAQEIRESRVKPSLVSATKTTHSKRDSADVWVNKLRCSCGSSFRKNKWHTKLDGKTSYGYQCYNQLNNGNKKKREELGLDTDGYCDTRMITDWKLDFMAKALLEHLWTERRKSVLIAIDLIKCYYKEEKEIGKQSDVVVVQARLDKANTRLTNLIAMRADGEITKDEYQVMRTPIDTEIQELQKVLENIPTDNDNLKGFDLDSIISTLNSLVDFSGSTISHDVINQFVYLVTPTSDTTFEWYVNLNGKPNVKATFTAEGRKKNCLIRLEEIERISSLHRKENESNAQLIKNPCLLTYLHTVRCARCACARRWRCSCWRSWPPGSRSGSARSGRSKAQGKKKPGRRQLPAPRFCFCAALCYNGPSRSKGIAIPMVKVLFICHGNICRSPMAEYLLRDMVRRQGLAAQFQIASAATSREEIGNDVYPPARAELRAHGVPVGHRAAVQVTPRDYDDYDWLLTMDENNARNLRRILPHDPDGKIRALLSFAGLQRGIADPWYTGDFGTTYDDLVLGCTAFLDALRRRGDI